MIASLFFCFWRSLMFVCRSGSYSSQALSSVPGQAGFSAKMDPRATDNRYEEAMCVVS